MARGGEGFFLTTSISVPDPVFQEAEQLGERLEKTRNQLYTEALIEYLARHNPEAITETVQDVLRRGVVIAQVRQQIEVISSLDRLTKLAERILTAHSLEEMGLA